MDLLDRVRMPFIWDCRKHDLAPDPEAFADKHINAMDNVELLRAIGERFDEAVIEAVREHNREED